MCPSLIGTWPLRLSFKAPSSHSQEWHISLFQSPSHASILCGCVLPSPTAQYTQNEQFVLHSAQQILIYCTTSHVLHSVCYRHTLSYMLHSFPNSMPLNSNHQYGIVQGAWGFWYLPGTPSFHVYWTGVAEVLGGVGITLGATNLPFVPDWLLPASGFGLFLLVAAVTPSNMYMWTHNSPGPTSEETLAKTGGVIPLQGHLFRAFLQVVLLSTFLAVAFPPN